MADEHLVEELADMLWRIEGNYHREGTGPGSRFEGETLQAVQVRGVLSHLDGLGRLVPDGAEVVYILHHPDAVAGGQRGHLRADRSRGAGRVQEEATDADADADT